MSDDPILRSLARLDARMDEGFQRADAGGARLETSVARLETSMDRLEDGQASLRTKMCAFRSGVLDELGKTRGAITRSWPRRKPH